MNVAAKRRDDPITPASAVVKIREPDFARRLNKALDDNPYAPEMNFGRLVWIREKLAEKGVKARTGSPLASETVRRWIHGEVKPRDNIITLLAEILEVDEAWLSLGHAVDLTPREQKARGAAADAAVNLVYGFIQMGGGHPALPLERDARAKDSLIDLYAIIKGAQYAFHVTLASDVGEDGSAKFLVPTNHEGAFQLGVIPTGELAVTLVEITEDMIGAGNRRGGVIEVKMIAAEIEAARIRSFRNRL